MFKDKTRSGELSNHTSPTHLSDSTNAGNKRSPKLIKQMTTHPHAVHAAVMPAARVAPAIHPNICPFAVEPAKTHLSEMGETPNIRNVISAKWHEQVITKREENHDTRRKQPRLHKFKKSVRTDLGRNAPCNGFRSQSAAHRRRESVYVQINLPNKFKTSQPKC